MRCWKQMMTVMLLCIGLTVMNSHTTWAAGSALIHPQWVDENKGPGAAKWVDDQGNVTEPTHMKNYQTPPPTEKLKAGQTDGPEGPGVAKVTVPQETAPVAIPPTATLAEEQAAEKAAGQTSVSPTPETQSKPEAEVPPEVPVPTTGRTIDPNRPMIALTFDDGPYAPVGNQIMDCLAKYGAKATFFVVGNRCATYKSEMRRMAADGHEIGNHTYEHKYLQKLNAEQIREQIQKGNEAIEATAGVKSTLVRLPGGCKNDTVLANVHAPMIMWNIDTEDWKTKNTQKTINAVIGKVKDGDIVLMHEIYKPSGAAAVQIIPALVKQGYQLVTVSELAQYRGGLENGKLYYKFRK